MENGLFIDELPIRNGDFPSQTVSLPEGELALVASPVSQSSKPHDGERSVVVPQFAKDKLVNITPGFWSNKVTYWCFFRTTPN